MPGLWDVVTVEWKRKKKLWRYKRAQNIRRPAMV
jgi:hypothetical protein